MHAMRALAQALIALGSSLAVHAADPEPVPRNFFFVVSNGLVGSISPIGAPVTPPAFRSVGTFAAGFQWVEVDPSKPCTGNFLDANGRVVLPQSVGKPPQMLEWETPRFDNGIAGVLLAGDSAGWTPTSGRRWTTPGGCPAYVTTNGTVALLTDMDDLWSGWLDRWRVVNEAGKWGFFEPGKGMAIPPRFAYAQSFHGDLAGVVSAGDPTSAWHLIDRAGKSVAGPFERVEPIRPIPGLWRIHRGGLQGAVSPRGVVLAAEYDAIEPLGEVFVSFRRGARWGFSDAATGRMIVGADYDALDCATPASVFAKREGQWRALGTNGVAIGAWSCDEVQPFDTDAGLRVIRVGDRTGMVDAEGALLLKPEFEQIARGNTNLVLVKNDAGWRTFRWRDRQWGSPAYEALRLPPDLQTGALFMKEGRWGLLNNAGRTIVDAKFSAIAPWNRLLEVRNDEGIDLLDYSGRSVLPAGVRLLELPQPSDMRNNAGRIVSTLHKCGLIDRDGNVLLSCAYDDIGPLSEELVPAARAGRWGFVDLHGNWKIDPKYDEAHPFSEGLATVRSGRTWSVIDRTGTTTMSTSFDGAGCCWGGLIPVARADTAGHLKWGLVHRAGEMVLPAAYDAIEWRDAGPARRAVYGALSPAQKMYFTPAP